MGANYSNFDNKSLQQFITTEYEKQRHRSNKKNRDFLILSDVLLLSLDLPDDYRFNTAHMGTLFLMDTDKDGRFSLPDLLEFGRRAISLIKSDRFKQHELNQQLQAHCTL